MKSIDTLYVTRRDPHHFMGGIEKHIRAEIQKKSKQNKSTATLFIHQSEFKIRLHEIGGAPSEHISRRSDLASLFQTHLQSASRLELHHTMGFSPAELLTLSTLSVPEREIFIHDFYLVTPSTQFLYGPLKIKFCHVEKNLSRCNRCAQNFYGIKTDITTYRLKARELLARFGRVVFPSANALSYFKEALETSKVAVATDRWVVRPHDLTEYFSFTPPTERPLLQSIVFLGAFGPHKGLTTFLKTLIWLKGKGISAHLVGHSALAPLLRLLGLAKVHAYQSEAQLAEIFRRINPSTVAMPSIWPETFSYTFFEALLLSGPMAKIIVGPWGNPADFVRTWKCGIVMEDATFLSLKKAMRSSQSFELEKKKAIKFLQSQSRELTN